MEDLRTPARVKVLIDILKEFNTITDELANHMSGKSLNTIQKVCNDFMNRTRINNEALIPIFEIYKSDASLLLPIGLIFRSMLSDFLTSSYLITFIHDDDKDENAIKNELLILDRDFLRSFLKAMELEKIIHSLNPDFQPPFNNEAAFEERLQAIKSNFKILYKRNDISQKLKEPKEFRETSLNELFNGSQEYTTVGGSFMSEEYKFDRIKRLGFGKYATAFIPFKYFSQFQHYSKRGYSLLDDTFGGFGYFHLVHSLNIVLISTQFQTEIVAGKGNEFTKKIAALVPKLNGALG